MPDPSTRLGLLRAVAGTFAGSILAGVLVTLLVAPAVAVTGMTVNSTVGIYETLPDYLVLDVGSQQNRIVALDADGAEIELATVYRQNREEVPLDRMSDHLECAAIAGEDKRFAEHGGVDLRAVARAVVGVLTGDDAGGGSTLTMQLVRNIWQQQAINDRTLTDDERAERIREATEPTLDRKIREMRFAIGLEQRYTKDQILAGYLNIANFGGNTYGLQAAAEQYFSKDAADLTVAEAAALIAIVQEPNARSLVPENFERNQARRDVILGEMRAASCITAAEYEEALATPVDDAFVNPSPPTVGCRNALDGFEFACDYALRVVDELEALGSTPEERQEAWERGGYTLVLTIDPAIQQTARDTVRQWAPAHEERFELGAAVASVQADTGWILAMAQNKDYDDRPVESMDDPLGSTSVNYAADFEHGGSIGFQPGSTYKPYVLLAYLDAGNGVRETFDAGIRSVDQRDFVDSCPRLEGAAGPPWTGEYRFRNDENERGHYSVLRGTARSVNSVFVQMAMRVDQCEIARLAESIGVHDAKGDPLATNPSCSIGGCSTTVDPITQAAAYAAIANHGVYCRPVLVRAVIGPDGAELPGQRAACGQSAVAPNVADTAAYAMAGVMSGTAGASNPDDGTPYIGKTGTTDNSVHTWMVGSSTEVATAVWVGNISGEQALRSIRVDGVPASLLRHRIFRPIAQAIDARYPGGPFAPPDPALLTGTTVSVPDVVGLTADAARNAIEVSELGYVTGGTTPSPLPPGTVVSTAPAAGAAVPRGTPVTVVVSSGPQEDPPNPTPTPTPTPPEPPLGG